MLFWLILLNVAGPYQDLPRVALSWQGPESWYPSLVSSLGERGIALFELPSGVADANDWGRQQRMDLIVFLKPEFLPDGVRVRYSMVEVYRGDVLSDGQWEAPVPSRRALVEAFWVPLLETFDRVLGELRGTQVRLRAAPGTLIKGLTPEDLAVDESGEVSVGLRTPATYPFRAVHPDLRPERGVLAALRDGQVFEIHQRPSRRFSVVVTTLMFSFPILEGRFHFFYDRFWVGLGLEQYLLGSGIRFAEGPSPSQALYSDPKFLVPYLSFGGFLDPADTFLRSYLALEAGPRLRTAFGDLDPVGRLQASLSFGMDWKFWEEFRLQLGLKLRSLLLRAEEVPQQWYFPDFNTFQVTLPTDFGGVQIPLLTAGLSWSF